MSSPEAPYRVYGMTQSYFTRKVTGYLDYKGIPWQMCRAAQNNPEVQSAGWPGVWPDPPAATVSRLNEWKTESKD